MPRYMMLLYVPVEDDDEAPADHQAWVRYTQDLHEAGVFVAGDPLHGNEAATTVRVRDGETQITDGPYAETKEFLGGYYILDVPDLDAALAWAAKVPNVFYGSTEVRPIMDFDPTGAPAAEAAAQA